MAAEANPYRPGFSQAPEVLAGRDDMLEAAADAVSVAAGGRTPRPLLFVGTRGVGKTVLLAEIARQAGAERGWPRLRAEATPDTSLVDQLIARGEALMALFPEAPGSRRFRVADATLRAGLGGVGAAVRFERTKESSVEAGMRLEAALGGLAEVARASDSGIVLTVDEAHLARRGDLGTMAAALQAGTEAGWPLVVVLAGLANIRHPERTVTYLERGEWHHIGGLDEASTLRALSLPARSAGRPFDPDTAQYLAEQTGGYPYAIQLYGHHAWAASEGQARIGMDAAGTGARRASRELEEGLYAGRWAQSPVRERQYLVAVAELLGRGEPATGAAVAVRLGLSTRQVSSYRDRLLTRGTLVAEATQLRFAVPGMAGYVRARADEVARPERPGRNRRAEDLARLRRRPRPPELGR